MIEKKSLLEELAEEEINPDNLLYFLMDLARGSTPLEGGLENQRSKILAYLKIKNAMDSDGKIIPQGLSLLSSSYFSEIEGNLKKIIEPPIEKVVIYDKVEAPYFYR